MCVVGGACRITHLSLKHTPIDVVWEGSDVNLDVMQRLMRATNVQQRLAAVQSGWKVIRSLACSLVPFRCSLSFLLPSLLPQLR